MEYEDYRIRMEKEGVDYATLALARSFSVLVFGRLASSSCREAVTSHHSGSESHATASRCAFYVTFS